MLEYDVQLSDLNVKDVAGIHMIYCELHTAGVTELF